MIKISINANRSDIAGYISYFSAKEIAPILDIQEEDIIYETAVVDYFRFGDIDFNTRVEALVSITQDYSGAIDAINEILAKYISGFASEFHIRYEIINNDLVFSYKVEDSHPVRCSEKEVCELSLKHLNLEPNYSEEECECDDDCDCKDHECHCHDNECECDDDCDCKDHECHCHDNLN